MGGKQSVLEGPNVDDHKSKLLHKIFEENLNSDIINRPALYYHDAAERVRETSFFDLNKKANRIAASILKIIRETDANRNEDGDYVIGVCMTTSDHVIATLLAIWKVGAAYLSLEPNLPVSRIQLIVEEVRPALVIRDHCIDSRMFHVNSISYDELLAKSSACSNDNIHTQNSVSCGEDDVAIILYTSGTTGVPRGVRIPHSAVWNKLRWLQKTFPYSASEKVGALTSALSNVDSVAEIWSPLMNGVAVLIVPQEVTRDPSKLVDLLESYNIQRLVLVPSLLTSILEYLSMRDERLLSNLKTWISSGETLATSLAGKFFEYFSGGTYRLCNFYGTTEVMGDVTYYVCENMEELEGLSSVPIGYPLDNTIVSIMNINDLNPVKTGEIGEICVAGLNLAKGYVAGKEKSKFSPNRLTDNLKFDRLYRTGDFGKLIKDGCIQYEGRHDSQIKVHGNRVELLEIEAVVRSLKEVDKGVVICYHRGKEYQAVLAFVVLKKPFEGLPSQQKSKIENILRTKLRDFEFPRVLVVKSIPLLPNGKIDRQSLLNVYEMKNEKADIEYDLTGIPDDRQKMVKDIFEIIGNVVGSTSQSTISPQSNFYDLGGDSLNSILTVTQLHEKGYTIGVTDFITAKCLADVVDKISVGGNVEENTKFKTVPLTRHHKHQAISIMTTTFHEKSDLGAYLMEHANQNDHKDFIEQTWDYLVEKDLSFAVTDRDGNIVGISINKDIEDLPKVTMKKNSLGIILQFLDTIEKPVLDKMLPKGKNKVFHSFILATSARLTPQENVEAVKKMEEVNLDIARRKGFIGIFTTNTNPLTQQLGSNIYGYVTLVDYQINKYVHRDGTRPFRRAPDSQRVLVQWKNISELFV